jgi:hypothetical protein
VPKVNKLFSLKRWLTLPEAARHLSILFGEDVSEADILQLALDGQLTLSVHFASRVACRIGTVVKKFSKNPMELFDDYLMNGVEGTILVFKSATPGETELIVWSQETIGLDGVWDLWGFGAGESMQIRARNTTTEAPSQEDRPVLTVRGPNGAYYQVLDGVVGDEFANDRTKPHSADRSVGVLPAGSMLVIRTSSLRELEARTALPEQAVEKPLGQRERDILLLLSPSYQKSM